MGEQVMYSSEAIALVCMVVFYVTTMTVPFCFSYGRAYNRPPLDVAVAGAFCITFFGLVIFLLIRWML